jgi:hypothetical protein
MNLLFYIALGNMLIDSAMVFNFLMMFGSLIALYVAITNRLTKVETKIEMILKQCEKNFYNEINNNK